MSPPSRPPVAPCVDRRRYRRAPAARRPREANPCSAPSRNASWSDVGAAMSGSGDGGGALVGGRRGFPGQGRRDDGSMKCSEDTRPQVRGLAPGSTPEHTTPPSAGKTSSEALTSPACPGVLFGARQGSYLRPPNEKSPGNVPPRVTTGCFVSLRTLNRCLLIRVRGTRGRSPANFWVGFTGTEGWPLIPRPGA